MKLRGKKIKLEQWMHSRLCVVHVEVEAVVPDADPTEPCLEPETVRWLDEVQRKADEGRIDELAALGDVYIRHSA